MKKVNILGTEWMVVESDIERDENLADNDGYCDTSIKVCVIDNMKFDEGKRDSKKDLNVYKRQVYRHEVIHAFLHESGLASNSWALNEEMVDWLAIQFPKILQAFKELDCL